MDDEFLSGMAKTKSRRRSRRNRLGVKRVYFSIPNYQTRADFGLRESRPRVVEYALLPVE